LLFWGQSPTLSAVSIKHEQIMSDTIHKDPLHGMTLEKIVSYLVDYYGWELLGQKIQIRCFQHDPSINSSLKFLRRTPWARTKVEQLYVNTIQSPWAK